MKYNEIFRISRYSEREIRPPFRNIRNRRYFWKSVSFSRTRTHEERVPSVRYRRRVFQPTHDIVHTRARSCPRVPQRTPNSVFAYSEITVQLDGACTPPVVFPGVRPIRNFVRSRRRLLSVPGWAGRAHCPSHGTRMCRRRRAIFERPFRSRFRSTRG